MCKKLIKKNNHVCFILIQFVFISLFSLISSAGLNTQGASNTAGWGAKLPLNVRFQNHLTESASPACNEEIKKRQIFFSIDYFFPTNFPQLAKLKEAELSSQIEKKLTEWGTSHELIILSLLPQKSLLKGENKKFIEASNGSINFIFDSLEKPEYKNGTALVNRILTNAAIANPKIKLLDFNSLIEAMKQPEMKTIGEKSMFKDQLHFNDLGQALVFNYWMQPLLKKISSCDSIQPMNYVELKDSQITKALAKTVLSPDEWLKHTPGNYWAKIESTAARSAAKVKFIIPAEILDSKKDIITSADDFDKIDRIRNEISDPKMKKRFTELYGVTQLVQQSDQTGFSVKLHAAGEANIYTFDLARIFFYTQLPFNRAAQNENGVIQAFGYDHWLSYKFYHRVLKWGVLFSPVPATNYHFYVKQDANNPLKLKVKLIIYPTVEVNGKEQEVEFVRLSHLPAPWLDEVKNNGSKYPHLEYEIDLVIGAP